VASFRYRLLGEDGCDLGIFTTRGASLATGDVIHRYPPGIVLQVERVVEAEDNDPDGVRGYLIVRTIDDVGA
jgi:hypothetical protein